MTSSPSPRTSIRAATISSRKARRSNSFPSLASLNPFRAKSAPEPSRPCEPFLVAPGIWSTDATAKVFGYLETDAKTEATGNRRLARSQSAGPDKRNNSPTPSSRSLFGGKSLLNRYKEVHKDDGTDDFSKRTHRQKRESWERERQQGRDEARLERETSQWYARRGRMRTVSQDDELTERGANPRTGVVSPYVTSDGSADGGDNDYIDKGYTNNPLRSTNRRTSDGRWQQTGGSWSFVERSIPSPTRLHPNDSPIRQVSVKKIQDKLLAQMPGADSPEPDNMSTQQIRRYQQSVERAYDLAGGSHAMLDPATLPTPRQSSPAFGTEGPSTPPNKLHKIRRKEVGSALQPQKSDDTMIVNHKQQSASARPPPIRMPSSDRQKVRIMSPSMAALGAMPRTPLDVEASFLGPHQHCCRTVSAGQFQSTLPLSPQTNQQALRHQPQSRDQKQSPPEASSAPRASSPTLSQSLPRLQFLHPSHFANLDSLSYRRPSHLLPPSLRSGPQKRQLVEDAATITTTTTLGKTMQRPVMQRLEGRNTVPRAKCRNLEDQMRSPEKSPSQIPLIKIFKPSLPTKSTGDNENARSSACLQTLSHQSLPSHKSHQVDLARASHHRGDQERSSLPPLPLSQSQAPSNQSQTQSGQRDGLSDGLRVISSKSVGPTKQVKDIPNTITDPIHPTLPYPGDRNLDGAERHVPKASLHHGNRQSSQNHRNISPPASKGCEISRSFASISKAKMNEVEQSSQVPNQGSTTAIDAAIHGARAATLGQGQRRRHLQNEIESRKRAGQNVSRDRRSNVRGAYGIVSDQAQQSQEADGIGITQTLDHQDQNISALGNGTAINTTARREEPLALTRSPPNSEGGVCFAGNWAQDDLENTDTQSMTTLSTNAEELLSRRRSLLRRSQELAHWLASIESISLPESYLEFAQHSLWQMIVHVASTLHYGSPAIRVLMMTDSDKAGGKERLYAAKDVALAVVYALLLLNLAMFLRRLVIMTVRVAYWIWHPFTALTTVIRWCLIV